jgi:hypothetical protein
VKANHGKVGEKIEMRWDDGIYKLDTGPDPVVAKVLDKSADDVFIAVFTKLTGQGQLLGLNVGPSYAPAKIAKHPDAKGYSKQVLAAAMQRLLDSTRLQIEITGPPSRRYITAVLAFKNSGLFVETAAGGGGTATSGLAPRNRRCRKRCRCGPQIC